MANNSKDGNVHYILVPLELTYRARELLAWLVTPKRVPGTMTLHDVMCISPSSTLAVRRMACYEDCCWDEETLNPRVPQRNCVTDERCHWGTAELFNESVLKKLDEKRRQIEKEKAKTSAIEKKKVRLIKFWFI